MDVRTDKVYPVEGAVLPGSVKKTAWYFLEHWKTEYDENQEDELFSETLFMP